MLKKRSRTSDAVGLAEFDAFIGLAINKEMIVCDERDVCEVSCDGRRLLDRVKWVRVNDLNPDRTQFRNDYLLL